MMPNLRVIHWRTHLVRITLETVGAIIGAIGVILFMAPFNIAPSGVSGLAVIANYQFGWPIGLLILIGNIPIQYIGYRMLGGWLIILRTVYVIVVYSLAIDLLTPYFPAQGVTDDLLLNAIFGGILGGISSGLVYRAGSTFGGTSTLALIVQQRTGLPLSTTFLYTDLGVIGLAGFVFGWEAALFAVIALFISGIATDYTLEGPSVIRTAVIITDQPEAVSQAILNELQRGVTAWDGRGMYTGQERGVLFVTIARPQVEALRTIVQQVDPGAFVVIGQGHVAYGQGFRYAKGG